MLILPTKKNAEFYKNFQKFRGPRLPINGKFRKQLWIRAQRTKLPPRNVFFLIHLFAKFWGGLRRNFFEIFVRP